MRRWHHQLTHLHIHTDWSRNVSWNFAKLQNFITSLFFNRFSSGFSLFCSENFTLSSEIKLDQLRTSPLSCAQCNAYLLYCVHNKQPARSQGRPTYIFEAIVSQAHVAICLREKCSPSENILWVSINVPLRSSGEGNILNYVSIMWVYLANWWLALD